MVLQSPIIQCLMFCTKNPRRWLLDNTFLDQIEIVRYVQVWSKGLPATQLIMKVMNCVIKFLIFYTVHRVGDEYLRQERTNDIIERARGRDQICSSILNSDHTLEFELEVWNVWQEPAAELSRVVSATPIVPWHYHCLYLGRIQPLTSIGHQASKRPRVQVPPPPPLISLATDSQKVDHCQPVWHLIHYITNGYSCSVAHIYILWYRKRYICGIFCSTGAET